MVVGILTVELHLPGRVSLKDKRQIVQSLKAHIRNKFNVSVAETGHRDLWQRCELGVAAVSADRVFIEKEMEKILDFIENKDGVEVIGQTVEFV